MNFLLSDDIQEFQKSLRATLEREISATSIRKALLTESTAVEFQRELHSRVYPKLAELGVFLAGIPESNGGLGAGLSALAMVCEECARALAPLPVFEACAFGLAPLLLLKNIDGDVAELLESLASGEKCVTGNVVPGHAWRISHNELAIEDVLMSSTLLATTGILVLRGGEGTLGVETAALNNAHDGAKLVQLEISSIAASASPEKSLDLLRPYSIVSSEHIAYRELGVLSKDELEKLEAIQMLLATAEIVGVASKVEALTLDYVKTRKQFGAPIGSFQAIQHKLADVHLAIESAQSLLRFAAWSADHDPQQFLSAAVGAKGYASESLPRAIEACLQAHGGIGFTFEYDLHLYLRRAMMMATQFGTASEHYLTLGKQAVL